MRETRNLFEQMNSSAYQDSTDPFAALYEAAHFSNAGTPTINAEDDVEGTGHANEGEFSKSTHKLTPEEMELQRAEAMDGADDAGEQERYGAISGLGGGRQGEAEVPLDYDNDADLAVDYDPLSGEELDRYPADAPLGDDEFEADNAFNNPEDPEAVLGETEPGVGGEEDLGTQSTKLASSLQQDIISQLLKNPMNNDELMSFLKSKLV